MNQCFSCLLDEWILVHFGPSMMSQGKTPRKDPPRGVTGVFPRHLSPGKTPHASRNPPKGSFQEGFPGTSLTVHSVYDYSN